MQIDWNLAAQDLGRFFTEPVSGGLPFLSMGFWLVFLLFLGVYALLKKSTKCGMMCWVIGFSLFFFYKANGWLMLLLPATAAANWLLVEAMRKAQLRYRKALLTVAVVIDLSALLYFKYTGFIIHDVLRSNFEFGQIALPIGISFYTFQAISYAVDVYRCKYQDKPTFLEYLFYLSYFPLLMAGPITRARTLLPQIRRNQMPSSRELWLGVWLIILGIVKKGVLADYIAVYNNLAFDTPASYSGYELLMAAFGYTMQIYLDFSGYSDLAIGLSALLGFRLEENFLFPYRSLNLTEFWRTWHISLSSWFRDYLYIPLGGNRKGKIRTLLNNFITMVVAGLWHGASWMFVIWGAMHGAGLVVHKLCQGWLKKIPDKWYVKAISWFITMSFVTAAWIFFRAPSMEVVGEFFGKIFGGVDLAYFVPFWQARTLWCIVMIIAVAGLAVTPRMYTRAKLRFIKLPWAVKLLILLVAVQLMIQLRSGDIRPFIYYQF